MLYCFHAGQVSKKRIAKEEKEKKKRLNNYLSTLFHSRAWHIVSDFGNRCEFGTIETPIQNSTAFSKPESGTREARPTDFPPFFQTNSESRLRRRALFFHRGGGANQNAILAHSIYFDTKRIFTIMILRPHSDCLF